MTHPKIFTSSILFATLSLLFAFSNYCSAQTLVSSKYDWDAKPQPHTLTGDDANAKEVGLKDKRILEYVYDDAQKSDLVMYYTKHTILKVNTHEAIEEFNKIYVPVGGVMDIIKLKARSISKDGKVTVLDKNDIKEADNLESKGNYKYFAMEGLEPGSEVEYIFTLKFDATFFDNEILQNDYVKKDVEFDLYSPENIEFEVKSYNGLAEMQKDTTLEDGRHWSLKVERMAALKNERYAAYNSNLQRVEYTFAYNHSSSSKRMFDWGRASETFFAQYFQIEDKEMSDVAKYMKKIDAKGSSDKDKLLWIDNYLKTNIAIQNVANPDLNDLRKIISNKVASNRGITRFYIAVLTQMNLGCELVITTDRTQKLFDGSFQTWNYLDHVMLFVPSLGIYLAPTEFTSRNGLPPPEWEENDGFFIKKVTVGDLTSGAGKVKHITPADYTLSQSNIYASAQLAEPFDEVTIKTKLLFTGHEAEFIQSYYDLMTDEQRKKVLDPLMQLMGDDAKVDNLKVTNDLNSEVENHPLIFEADVTLSSLIEKAGNKILFKIGNMLGEQDEMYSDEKRENPVENQFAHSYHREFSVTVPIGYQVKNPDALKLNVDMKEGSETPCFFHASYNIEGNVVKVTIDEVYKKIHFPVSEYESFQKVINAAADYNKVVLIFEKAN